MDTIYSLVTKPINQNVGIIRISGPETFDVIKKMFPNVNLSTESIKLQKLFINDIFIDDVLLLIFISPKSFTGENTVEIQFHGSMYVAKQIISQLEKYNLVQSKPGEFTKQAFLNNKIDLIQSEAINELITTESDLIAKKASQNLNKKQSYILEEILSELENIMALIQVSIDYPENTDLPQYSHSGIEQKVNILVSRIQNILYDSKKLVNSSKGVKIALIGLPNVGKSTLLNSILNEERAITSNIAGTTRDIIESTIYLNGTKVTLFDTAGIRKTSGQLEKKSIEKTLNVIESVDLVCLLLDPTRNIKKQEDELLQNLTNNKIVKIITKWDKVKNDNDKYDNYLKISALINETSQLLNYLNNFIETKILNFKDEENAILISTSQISNLEQIFEVLKKVSNGLKAEQHFDLISYEIEEVLDLIKKILGIKKDPNYLEELFSNFCIGK